MFELIFEILLTDGIRGVKDDSQDTEESRQDTTCHCSDRFRCPALIISLSSIHAQEDERGKDLIQEEEREDLPSSRGMDLEVRLPGP